MRGVLARVAICFRSVRLVFWEVWWPGEEKRGGGRAHTHIHTITQKQTCVALSRSRVIVRLIVSVWLRRQGQERRAERAARRPLGAWGSLLQRRLARSRGGGGGCLH